MRGFAGAPRSGGREGLLRPVRPPPQVGQADPEHQHLFSQEAKEDIVQTDRQLTLRLIEEIRTFTPQRVWETIT